MVLFFFKFYKQFYCLPVAPEALARSDPAKSTKWILLTVSWGSPSVKPALTKVTEMWNKKMFLKTWDISDANIQSFRTYFFYYLKKERKKKWSDRSKSIVLLTNVKKEVDQTSKHFKFPPYFQRFLQVFKEGNSSIMYVQ